MKKIICGFLAAISLFALLSGCGEPTPIKEPPQIGFLVAGQFSGYRLGIIKSLNTEEEVLAEVSSPEFVEFSSVSKAVSALRNDKIHGLVLPAPYAEEAVKKHDDISKLYIPLAEKKLCALAFSNNQFIFGLNAAATAIHDNGMAEKIASTHLGNGKSVRPADYDKVEGRILRVGVVSEKGAPLCYKDKEGELFGINVDTAYAFAERIHADLVISDYKNDEALLKALDADEIDVAINDFIPNSDDMPSSKYRFTHPYADLSTHILIKGDTPRVATEGFSSVGE